MQIKNSKGFSLIELMFSVAIMALLIGVMVPQFAGMRNKVLETSVGLSGMLQRGGVNG